MPSRATQNFLLKRSEIQTYRFPRSSIERETRIAVTATYTSADLVIRQSAYLIDTRILGCLPIANKWIDNWLYSTFSWGLGWGENKRIEAVGSMQTLYDTIPCFMAIKYIS